MTELAAMPDAEISREVLGAAALLEMRWPIFASKLREAARRLAAPKGGNVESHKCPECGWRTVLKPPFPGIAPQAAPSADERAERECLLLELETLFAPAIDPRAPYAKIMLGKAADLIAGYRKHAAPDVAVEGLLKRPTDHAPKVCYCTERCMAPRPNWCPEPDKRDRLAALPKGQEDE